MIEPKIIECVEIGDSLQKMYIYNSNFMIHFFSFFRTMLKYKQNNLLLIIFLKLYFYFQFMMIPIIKISKKDSENDTLIKFFLSIKKIIFIQDLIDSKKTFLILLTIVYIYCILLISLIINLIVNKISSQIKQAPLKLLNLLNLLLINAFLCPIINILLLTVKCNNKKHIYLNIECYKNFNHFLIVIISMIFLVMIIIYSILLSIYYHEIGSIKGINYLIGINSNLEFLSNILGIISFFLTYFLKYYMNSVKIEYRIINRIYIFISSIILAIYSYKSVFYYNNQFNNLNMYSWALISWYSLSLLLKKWFNFTNCILLVFIGWIIIIIFIYILNLSKNEYYLTEFNVLEANNLKDIEMFTSNLLNIAMDTSIKSKTLLIGLLKTLNDFFENNPEINAKYQKFRTNQVLIDKYGGPGVLIFDVYNIIYIIYDYYLDKSELKDNILLVFSYFLSNKLKNMTYALSLCSKIKLHNHKLKYLKYLLIEDLIEYFLLKLTKKAYVKDTLKNIEFGSVIIYNSYINKIKLKIYDAACSQIDYFDILRNNTNSKKSTKTFLKLGNTILQLRKEILEIWDKIINLNPFSDEIEKDYMLYLETIIQDEHLVEKEKKRYNMIKTLKLSEKNNIYYTLFIKELTSIILIDANNNNKIVFATSNFSILFNYSSKEIMNFTINDLIPNCIVEFHKFLIDDAIKYSNLTSLFNKKAMNFLLKSKTNGIYMIKIFIKCLPNLSYGIIYIGLIEKIKSNQFVILLDEDFKINCFSDPLSLVTNSYSISSDIITYGLNSNIIGHHIGVIIPEILRYIKFVDNKFYFSKNDIDIKSFLLSNVHNCNDDEIKINSILEKIKEIGIIKSDENNNEYTHQVIQKFNTIKYKNEFNIMEYNNFILNMKEKFFDKTYSIFYKVIGKTFLNNKYSYYRIYITNDLLEANETIEKKSNNEIDNSILVKNNLVDILTESNIFKIPQSILKRERGIKLKKYDENINKKDSKTFVKEQDKKKENKLNNMNNTNNTNNTNNQNLNNDDNNNKLQEPQKSFVTKSSIDSVSFNKLKSRILEKNESFHIIYLRLLSIIFLLISIVLIYFNTLSIKNKFQDLLEFINENYFFNHTKIIITNMYINSINLRYIKNKIIKDLLQIDISTSIFKLLIDKISIQIGKIGYLDKEYEEVLNKVQSMNVYIYDMNSITEINVDGGNLLSLILSNGIRLRANIETYLYNDTYNTFEVYCQNLINSTYDYLNNDKIKGLNIEDKIEILESGKFETNKIYLIINIIIFAIIFTLFIWLDVELYLIEKDFLKKLIMFRTNNFDYYLQYLDELKKKLKSVPDDDDKNDDQLNESNNNNLNKDDKSLELTSKIVKKKTFEEKTIEKKELKLNEHNDNNENSNLKIKKKKKVKFSKMQQQKKEKIEIMGNYFIIYNIFFCIKVCGIVFIAMTNYIIVYLINLKKRDEFFDLDNKMNEIIGIFKDNYLIYAYFKRELYKYINYEMKKTDYINQLQNGSIKNVTINNVTYTENDIEKLNYSQYSYDIEMLSSLKMKIFGSSIYNLLSNRIGKSSLYDELKILFNGDVCDYLFSDNETTLIFCNSFWSSILKQGIEQSTTQLKIDIDNLLSNLKLLNDKDSNVTIGHNNIYYIEIYITFYFMWAIEKTFDIFDYIRKDYIKFLTDIFRIIYILYFIIILILIIPLNFTIYKAKENFNSFLNFIGILPIQYLSEDDNFYKATLKLEGKIFY